MTSLMKFSTLMHMRYNNPQPGRFFQRSIVHMGMMVSQRFYAQRLLPLSFGEKKPCSTNRSGK